MNRAILAGSVITGIAIMFSIGVIGIANFQNAHAGALCSNPSPSVIPDMIDETLQPGELLPVDKVFSPNPQGCEFQGFDEPPFLKDVDCSNSGFDANIVIDVSQVTQVQWDETITVNGDADPGEYHCTLFWRLLYSGTADLVQPDFTENVFGFNGGGVFTETVKQEIWITVTSLDVFEKTLVEDFAKSDIECTTGMPIGALTTTMCTFSIQYIGEPLLIVDTVPAEWVFVGQDPAATCDVGPAGKGNPSKSATKIDCGVTDNLSVEFKFETRQSPGKNNVKFAPTSCDKELKLNESALALDPITMEIIETSNMIGTPTVDDPNDTDCDQVENDKDMCPFSDPINLGPIDDWGCDRLQTDS